MTKNSSALKPQVVPPEMDAEHADEEADWYEEQTLYFACGRARTLVFTGNIPDATDAWRAVMTARDFSGGVLRVNRSRPPRTADQLRELAG